jgi:hypothetical protein
LGNTNGHCCRITVLTICFIGIGKRILSLPEILKGFIPFLGSLLSAGSDFSRLEITPDCHPQYNDLLNGFTYNGHVHCCFVLLYCN